MKFVFSTLFIFIGLISFSQFDEDIKTEEDSCYFKYDANGNRLKTAQQRRYAEWECGKLAGVIDCNAELSYDEASNTVTKKANDNVNLSGVGKPFTGTCEMCHMNGTLQRRVTFVNGKENGIDTSYYKSGCLQVIRSHIQGSESGTWYYYYDSVALPAWEMNFYLGEKHGKQIYYELKKNDNGHYLDTTLWENYANGVLHGTKRTYYDSSKIKREVNYTNGVFDGSFKIYNRLGVVIQELTYKQGKKDGEGKYYYDDGELLKTESWDMGIKNGEFKIFYYGGQIQESENYKKGRKEGWFEEFYPDGKEKRTVLYKKDELIEEHRFDEHGRETYTFGATPEEGAEDDEMPTGDKKKKKKKKEK